MANLTPAPEGYPIKLVRDRTPEIINGSGKPGDLFYAKCPPHERKYRLRQKLYEEVGEYLLDAGIDELADVYGVVEALAIEHGASMSLLARLNREDPRGGFLSGIVMYGRHPEFDLADNERIRRG